MRLVHMLAFLAAGAPALAAAQSAPACASKPDAPRLDHAVLIVRDLDAASARFASLGFRLKNGRLHDDSLLNRHIKFRDGTGLELMSLAGTPGNAMARNYARRLEAGEGGATAALRFDDLDRLGAAAHESSLAGQSTRLGGWQFFSVAESPGGGALFFLRGGVPVADADSLIAHAAGSSRLAGAWIEAGPKVEQLLHAIGATRCGEVRLPDGRVGARWMLAAGSLVIVRPRGDARSRLIGVELDGPVTNGRRVTQVLELYPGFWLTF